MRMLAAQIAFVWLAFCTLPVSAQWGDLRLRFVVRGKTPPARVIDVRGKVHCLKGQEKFTYFPLEVGKNGGLKNVVVWLQSKEQPPIHPDYPPPDKSEAVMAVNGCRFEPFILTARVGQTLVVTNQDSAQENSYGYEMHGNFFNPQNASFTTRIAPKSSHRVKLKVAEGGPVFLGCYIHNWLQGYVLVQNHPYVGVSDANGDVVLRNLPAGKWNFKFWHPEESSLPRVGDAKADADRYWRRKPVEYVIVNGKTTDVGELSLTYGE